MQYLRLLLEGENNHKFAVPFLLQFPEPQQSVLVLLLAGSRSSGSGRVAVFGGDALVQEFHQAENAAFGRCAADGGN